MAFAECMKVLARAGLDGTEPAAIEALNEASDSPEGVLEGEPGVPLTERRAAWQPDVAGGDTHGGMRPGAVASRLAGSTREAGRAGERRGPERLAGRLDCLEDRRQGDELARRVEVEHVVDQPLGARDDGKAAADSLAGGVRPDFAVARRRSSASSGACRSSPPPS